MRHSALMSKGMCWGQYVTIKSVYVVIRLAQKYTNYIEKS